MCSPCLAKKATPVKQSVEAVLRNHNSLKAIQENRSAVRHEIDRARAGTAPGWT